MIKKIAKAKYEGIIAIPSSKSDTQRALLVAALAKGTSILSNLGFSNDEKAIFEAIQVLGAKVTFLDPSTIELTGIDHITEEKSIYLGESGLGIRLLASISAIFDKRITLTGSGSLSQRPMDFFNEILPQFQVQVTSNKGFIPLEIQGPLVGSEVELDGSLSSQFLSGLLIALPLSDKSSILEVKNLASIPYVEMTLNTLKQFGVHIQHENFKCFHIEGKQVVRATYYQIEGDWSSAAFWLVASALGINVGVTQLNLESFQADKAILNILESANCRIIHSENTIRIDGSNRKAFEADLTDCPDLFPILAVFAALTSGKSNLIGTKRLTHKESNRAQAILEEYTKLGCKIELQDNEMWIEGIPFIRGTKVSAHNDHRMAMSLGIFGLLSENEIEIEGAESVAKSYPNFWVDLESLKKK